MRGEDILHMEKMRREEKELRSEGNIEKKER